MKYHRTPIEVDAVKMTVDFAFNGSNWAAGSYIVTFDDGEQQVFPEDRFESEYAPGEFEQTKIIEGYSQIADEIISRNVGAAPAHVPAADIERDEQQTSVGVCFTCGDDVRISQMDALKNCPKCASKYILKPAAEVVQHETKVEAGPRIVLCPACGGPGPAERMNDKGCFRCDPELMAQAMAHMGV